MNSWYLSVGGTQYGPYTWEQLVALAQQQRFAPHDFVCPAGGNWIAARDVPGLFAAPAAQQAWNTAAPPQASSAPAPQFTPTRRRKRSSGLGMMLIALVGGVAIAGGLVYYVQQVDVGAPAKPAPVAQAPAVAPTPTAQPEPTPQPAPQQPSPAAAPSPPTPSPSSTAPQVAMTAPSQPEPVVAPPPSKPRFTVDLAAYKPPEPEPDVTSPVNGVEVPQPLAFFHFNEEWNATDSKGAAAEFRNVKFENGEAVFNGSGATPGLASVAKLTTANVSPAGWTMVVRFKAADFAKGHDLLLSTTPQTVQLRRSATGKLSLVLRPKAGGGGSLFEAPGPPLEPDRWTVVTVAVDRKDKSGVIYIDGEQRDGFTLPDGADVGDVVGAAWSFADPTSQTAFHGSVSDFYLYDGVLSTAQFNEVRTHADLIRARIEAERIAAGNVSTAGSSGVRFFGATWIELPPLPPPSGEALTVEAIVTLMADGDQAVVGNAQHSGFALQVRDNRWAFAVHDDKNYQQATAAKPIELKKRVHLAGVYDGDEVRLYVDGKLQATEGKMTGSHRNSTRPLLVGAQPGRDNLPTDLFHGTIHAVRISDTAVYTGDFEAPTALEAAEACLVALPLDEGDGDIAHDRAGHGRDGLIREPEWAPPLK